MQGRPGVVVLHGSLAEGPPFVVVYFKRLWLVVTAKAGSLTPFMPDRSEVPDAVF